MRWAIATMFVASMAVASLLAADDADPDGSEKAGPGAPEITGAFGFELGANFDPAAAIGTETNAQGEVLYAVAAPIPVAPLDIYQVLATPSTHRIAALFGRKRLPAAMDCSLLKVSFVRVLSQYYGEPHGSDPEAEARFGGMHRGIGVACDAAQPGAMFTVRYFDRLLLNEYQRERTRAAE